MAREVIGALHEEDGITTILGPMTSANVDAIREYVDQNGMISLSCCSSGPRRWPSPMTVCTGWCPTTAARGSP